MEILGCSDGNKEGYSEGMSLGYNEGAVDILGFMLGWSEVDG